MNIYRFSICKERMFSDTTKENDKNLSKNDKSNACHSDEALHEGETKHCVTPSGSTA